MKQSIKSINYLAMMVAGFIFIPFGWLWYDVLFQEPWMNALGLSMDDLNKSSLPLIFLKSYVLELLITLFLVFILGPDRNAAKSALIGLMTGIFVALTYGVTYMFDRQPLSLFLIHGGEFIVTFTLMATVLGAWRKAPK